MALENKDKIKDLFSSKLQNFEPEVPASLWAGIDQSLSQPAATPGRVSKMLWLKVAAAVAAVALITVGIIIFWNKEDATPVMTPPVQIVENPIDSAYIEQPVEPVAPEKELPVSPQRTAPRYANREEVKPVTPVEKKEDLKEEPKVQEAPVEETPLVVEQPEPTDLLVVEEIKEEAPKLVLDKRSGGMTIGLLSSLDLYADKNTQQGGILSFADGEPLDEALCYGNNIFEMEHDRPISFGLTVSKDLTNNLSIETGLVYTYLASSIKSDNNFKLREKQKFHYLGIPVSLNYTFLRYKRLESYVAVGGMIQKDIHGSYNGNLDRVFADQTGEYFFEHINTTKRNIHQSKPQFSTHFNVGLTYPLYNRLYLYGTFGGVYYFDASNKYRTIYSDKDLQLDLNLGLKWKF
ncbi:hypothetical protein [Dysgonomonas sp. 25]|uniref:hypothetical protein n=1 Tax=Dysgonomonas sp. 25 TaxID=2302933 RepID=UPI0013D79F7A|nr:hypothetical protein [Dysgonomonas sp. 25]NDV70200.1 hypothetical protein [Dysgonomonas sp. 25]